MIMNGKRICKGDLVAVKFIGGDWKPVSLKAVWKENTYHSYFYATVADIRKPGDVPHTGEPEACIKVEWDETQNPNSSNPMFSWEDPKDLFLICNSRKLDRILE